MSFKWLNSRTTGYLVALIAKTLTLTLPSSGRSLPLALWACDFVSKKVWTTQGLVDMFVLFFIHVQSRRVHIAGMTAHPDHAWMTQQARSMAMLFSEQLAAPRILLWVVTASSWRNSMRFLESEEIEVKAVGPCMPTMNAYGERWGQSIQQECLDHFAIVGDSHLRHIVPEHVTRYNENRPEQSKDNLPLSGFTPA